MQPGVTLTQKQQEATGPVTCQSALHEHRTHTATAFAKSTFPQKLHRKRGRKDFSLLNFLLGFPVKNQNSLLLCLVSSMLTIIKFPYSKNTNNVMHTPPACNYHS